MYTGTLIEDLVATVERAERGALRKHMVDEMELLRMFDLQVRRVDRETVLVGAA